jgi:hypothetical protein
MHQHWVPASYLRAWYDPASEHPQNPYAWTFSKDGSEVRRKSPENLFHERDMYTFTDKDARLVPAGHHVNRDDDSPDRIVAVVSIDFAVARSKTLSGQPPRPFSAASTKVCP